MLDPTDRRKMESRGNKNTLTITNVQGSDFGNYSCVADNSLGRTKKYMELSGNTIKPLFHNHLSASIVPESGKYFLDKGSVLTKDYRILSYSLGRFYSEFNQWMFVSKDTIKFDVFAIYIRDAIIVPINVMVKDLHFRIDSH
jgi:hypothetical protein